MGGQCQPHGKRADNGRCRSVGAGWRSRSSPPEHCRSRSVCKAPGWPPLEPRTRAGGGQLGEATLNHRRGARVPDPGPDEQSGVGAGGSKQAHQTYPCCGSCQMGCCFELFGRRALGGRASQAHLDRYGPGKSLTIASFEIIMVGRDCRSVGRDSRCGAAGFRHSWGTARKAGAKCRTKGRKQTCEPLQIVVVYLAVRELLRFRRRKLCHARTACEYA